MQQVLALCLLASRFLPRAGAPLLPKKPDKNSLSKKPPIGGFFFSSRP
jgi:hypothetical protein